MIAVLTDGTPLDLNRPPRLSNAARTRAGGLSGAHVRELVEASLHACRLGLPFNRFITINWERAGVDHVQRAQGAFMKRARDWLRTVGSDSAHIWVVERGRRVGLHVHALMHVDPRLTRQFSRRQAGWLRRSEVRMRRRLIKSKPIGRSYWLALNGQYRLYAHHLAVLIDYVTKNRRDNTGQCGIVPLRLAGKRCATSENVGRKARSSARPFTAPIAQTYANDFDKKALEAAIWEALEAGVGPGERRGRSLIRT